MRGFTILLVLTLLLTSDLHAATQDATATHPVLSTDARWVVSWLLIPIGAMFVAAIMIGIIARMEAADELPPTHSHDEPPGASHHHGPHGHGGH